MEWQSVLEAAQATFPPDATIRQIIADINPDWRLVEVTRMHGGLGSVMHRLDMVSADDELVRLVLKQAMPEWGETPDDFAREVATMQAMADGASVPVPDILWTDASGDRLGRPAMLIQFIPGNPLVGSLGSERGQQLLAQTLFAIHQADVDTDHLRRHDSPGTHVRPLIERRFESSLVDANQIMAALESATPRGAVEPVPSHGDFHGGNVLWDGTKTTAVLDWPMATVASPFWDEAYAHMDTWLAHGSAPARSFRDRYRELRGTGPSRDAQRFWDLTAVVRALPGPGQWLAAYTHSGVADLTTEILEQRYIDMVEQLI